MRWIKIFLIVVLLYGGVKQQLYSSTIKHKSPDARVALLEQFLSAKKSPLAGSSAIFIQVADREHLDWKLLPAIAGVESGFETAGNIHDYNPFGYMCGDSPCYFPNYLVAIETVAKTISRGNAYVQYRKTGSIYQLAEVYNYVYPEDWTEKIEYFEGRLK